MKSKSFFKSNLFIIIICVVIFFIIGIMCWTHENCIEKFLNFKIIIPEPDKVEILYSELGRDPASIEKWTYSSKKIKKLLMNNYTQNINTNDVNKIFDHLLEGWYGRFQNGEIEKNFDRRLINDNNFYISRVIGDEKVVSNDALNTPNIRDYLILIIDVESNEVFVFESMG